LSTQSFINQIAPGAQEAMRKYGVLASLSIAQAALESGWGAHAPGNNLFGIKSNGWMGTTQVLTTTEEINNKTITIKDLFRAYASWAASIEDHALFLVKNSRYRNLIGVTDYQTVCNRIKADGYATESSYATSLITLIQKYKLYIYDTLPTSLHVDSPAQNSAISGIKDTTFFGWVISPKGIKSLDIYADGIGKIGLAHITNFSNRPDVSKNANPFGYYKNSDKSGFSCVLLAGRLKSGKHSIDFAAIDTDGGVQVGHRYIVVK
jgi:hypothetical protein